MASFKDINGKEWTLRLDAPLIDAVRKELKVNLVAADGSGYEQLLDDPVLLSYCLWRLCSEQAGHDSITCEQFWRAFDGDAIQRAADALLAAILSFSLPRPRQLLAAAAAENAKARELGTRKALAKMEALNSPEIAARLEAAIDAELEAALQRTLTRLPSATSSPASSESAPAG